ncbi:MAG: T9SS type A sorting domain-containing protein [Bacteroidales bacterium]|nr:T9SS type A sorting domain-containing protein [Bacteroidales bacterium]
MKKILIISFLLGSFAISSQAQFLMKSNTHILRAGDEHYFNLTNNVDPGIAGPYQVWDFSGLESKSKLTSYMYNAYSSDNSIDIPEANTVLEEFETKFYFKTLSDKIEQYGTVTKNNTITKYDKPFIKMVFPFNYGDSYSGNFSGTIEGANNYKANITGTYLLEADAFGTLILPGNITYKNVFRIKTVREEIINNNSCNCATISYKWYSYDIRYPLLTIIQRKSLKGTKTFQTAYYSKAKDNTDQKSKGFTLDSENIKAKIYPNPFMDEFKLDYTIINDSDVRIEVYNNSGKKVSSIQKPNQKAGTYTETMKSDNIGNQLGMFHIRIIAGNDILSKTVIRGD